jgi:hypothetical protein
MDKVQELSDLSFMHHDQNPLGSKKETGLLQVRE